MACLKPTLFTTISNVPQSQARHGKCLGSSCGCDPQLPIPRLYPTPQLTLGSGRQGNLPRARERPLQGLAHRRHREHFVREDLCTRLLTVFPCPLCRFHHPPDRSQGAARHGVSTASLAPQSCEAGTADAPILHMGTDSSRGHHLNVVEARFQPTSDSKASILPTLWLMTVH